MKVYSFQNTVMLVNGVEITGWDEGDDVIQIERLSDSASHKIGAAGDMMVSISADKSGSFKFKLQQTSSSNNASLLMGWAPGNPTTEPSRCLWASTSS